MVEGGGDPRLSQHIDAGQLGKTERGVILAEQVPADHAAERHEGRIAGMGDGLGKGLVPVAAGIDVAFHRLDARHRIGAAAEEVGVFGDQPFLDPLSTP